MQYLISFYLHQQKSSSMNDDKRFGTVNVADFLRQVHEGVTSQLIQFSSELRKREISNELTIGNVFVLFFGI